MTPDRTLEKLAEGVMLAAESLDTGRSPTPWRFIDGVVTASNGEPVIGKYALDAEDAAFIAHCNPEFVLEVAREVERFTWLRAERERQDAKWGEQNHDDEWWLAILTEEVGELAQGVLHERFGGEAQALPELIHVAAVAVGWYECKQRRAALANPAAEEKP